MPTSSQLYEFMDKQKATLPGMIDAESFAKLYIHFFKGVKSNLYAPHMTVLGGAAGAGKTTYRQKYLLNSENYFIYDVDEVVELLPSYKRELDSTKSPRLARRATLPLAKKIADLMLEFALENKMNIIFETTLESSNDYSTLEKAKSLGYRIELYGFYVENSEEAIARAIASSYKKGRVAFIETGLEHGSRFSCLWNFCSEMAKQATLFESSQGDDYERLSSKVQGRTAILNKEKYKDFEKIGKMIDAKETFPTIIGARKKASLEVSRI